MKRLVLVAFIATSSFSVYAQVNEVCYTDTALMVEGFDRKGQSVWALKNEYQVGDWNIFYDFSLKKIKSESHYTTTGVKIGVWKEYYPSGKAQSEWNYDLAISKYYPIGKEYYESGAVKIERTQTADSLFENEYFASGKLCAYRKRDKNAVMVLEKKWCENGQLTLSYNPTSSTIIQVQKFHCNGKTQSEYNWWMYGYVGSYKEYHDNGAVAISGQFTEKPANETVFMARKTGDWTFYDSKRKLTKTETWKNGVLVKTVK